MSVPEHNSEVYCRIYEIEVGLREYIIETFEHELGPGWWRQLPVEPKEFAKQRLSAEREYRWNQTVPHHLIYYTDFPHLRQLAEQGSNWTRCFAPVFGSNKELLLNHLSELVPIRNKIAHNRRATAQDVTLVRASYDFIVGSLGSSQFDQLVSRCTEAPDIRQQLGAMQASLEHTWTCCSSFAPVSIPPLWAELRNAWWFDTDYLLHDVQPVRHYIQLIAEYVGMPQHRGMGHHLEAWVTTSGVNESYEAATECLTDMLDSKR